MEGEISASWVVVEISTAKRAKDEVTAVTWNYVIAVTEEVGLKTIAFDHGLLDVVVEEVGWAFVIMFAFVISAIADIVIKE